MKDTLTGGAVSAGTTGTGLAQLLGVIPDDIGKIAVLLAILVSSANLWYVIRKSQKQEIEITRMKKEE